MVYTGDTTTASALVEANLDVAEAMVEEYLRRELALAAGRSFAPRLAREQESVKLVAMSELIFEVLQEEDGGFVAECLTESIFTQADTWEELRRNVREAVEAFHFDRALPSSIRLHLIRDEVMAIA